MTDPEFRRFSAGMTQIVAAGTNGGRDIPISVWYPSAGAEERRKRGLYTLSAAFDAPLLSGPHPLIVISHGSGGGDLNHHDWAEALARAGYVVAAVRHIGDSHDFGRGLGSREQLLLRPRQLGAAIDAVRSHSELGGFVDPFRLGLMGFSAGGYTCLNVLGACPDFTLWPGYCRENPGAAVLCPVGKAPSLPVTCPGDWHGVARADVGAAVLFAPFSMVFGKAQLAKLRLPLRIYRAADESVIVNSRNADEVIANAAGRVEAATVPGDHYVFIAPVDEETANRHPTFYRDAPGIDRPAIHARIADELIAFFDASLPRIPASSR